MLPMAESRRDRNRQADPPGTAPRRTALRLLDAVLRRGEPLDIAAHAATQGLAPADRAFAIAIVSEAMRWMVDIDALIDGATSEILPEDVKARAVLPLPLAHLLVLKSQGPAVVATGLQLVAGERKSVVEGTSGSERVELARV